MITITNRYANKTAEKMQAISTNLRVPAPTIPDIQAALVQASAEAEQIEERIAGADVHWSTEWAQALGGDVIEKMRGFLKSS